MNPEQLEQLRKTRGLVATVVLSQVESWYADCHEQMARHNDRMGVTQVEYRRFDAKLVEAGRDAAVRHMLENQYDYIIQIDADATFPADAVLRLLHTAYFKVPDADLVGAYCQLKGPPMYCPTIDTGSGTWEPHFPGEGVIPVIRTGAHFHLCKRSAFEKTGLAGPWYRTRLAPRPIDMLSEVDGFARQNLHGRNPLTETEAWQTLVEKAVKSSEGGPSSVGEDSSFCDLLASRGGRLYVDCDIVTGHITKEVIGPERLKKALDDRAKRFRLACGILE